MNSLVRGLEADFLSVYQDVALVSAGARNDGHAEEDIHQRGFSGAVLSDEGVDFALPDIKIDVCQNAVSIIAL
jgi:hypothetical protein